MKINEKFEDVGGWEAMPEHLLYAIVVTFLKKREDSLKKKGGKEFYVRIRR